MQDEAGLMTSEDGPESVPVIDVGHDRDNHRPRATRDELLFGLIEEHLTLIEEDEATGHAGGDLPA
jgi:hypothetical protein